MKARPKLKPVRLNGVRESSLSPAEVAVMVRFIKAPPKGAEPEPAA